MKKAFLILTILLGTTFFLYSQIEKGTVMVGGNAGFQFRKIDKKNTEFQFSLSPNALYHPIKYLGIGGQISYAHYYIKRVTPLSTTVSAQNAFGIGPALRENIPLGKKAFLFFHEAFSGGVNVTRDPVNRNESYYSYSQINWRFGPGFSVFATKNMAVEFGFYYDGMKEVLAIKQNKSVLVKGDPVFAHGLTVAIGLQFYAHKKPKSPTTNQ